VPLRRHQPRSQRNAVNLRRGYTFVVALGGVAVVTCLALASWSWSRRRVVAGASDLLTATVWKGPYEFALVEQGTVESASNTEVRCQVRSRGGSATILHVVPEGTFALEGETLVELDSSGLKLEENAQQILVSTRQSLLAQAENTLQAAKIAKTEYLEGLFVSQEKAMMSALFVAEQARSTAEQGLHSAQLLHAKGVITQLQVQTAEAALHDAANKLDAAQTALATLRNLTKEKEQTRLEAAIAAADAEVKAQQQSLLLEEEQLKFIQEQIAHCTIKAPASGEVVYANEAEPWRSTPFIVAPGTALRERQVILWLPNASDMQVRTTVNEARVMRVRPGMRATIRVDAMRDELIAGEVTKVGQFSEPGGFFSGNIKKYSVLVKLNDPPRDLRVGMNAEVRIHVEQVADALQLPVEALVESEGHYFSLVKEDDEYETREVEVISTNDRVATIERGLKEGDEVVVNPRSAGDELQLPDLPDDSY
jgi:HlyD family secretion protein